MKKSVKSQKGEKQHYSATQIRLLIAAGIMLIFSIIIQVFNIFCSKNTSQQIYFHPNKAKLIQPQHLKITKFTEIIGLKFKNFPIFGAPTYIVAGGDVMLSRNIGYYAKKQGYDRIFKEGNYNPISDFSYCTGNNCSLFLNLESLFSTNDHDIQMGGFDFRSNPKNIETLLQYKGNRQMILALSNNHFSNGGLLGLQTTKQLLAQNHIKYVGAGESQEESRTILSRNQGGINFCMNAYSYDGGSAISHGGRVYRNSLKEENIKSDLSLMKEMKCDVKIISLHRGAEYRFSPNNRQRNLAHNIIDSGADLILGGHSHIPGEFEQYNGKYIFYSLGNFIFDQGRGKTAKGREFDYFYDDDLKRNTVPTYISMLVGLKFSKNINQTINIELNQIELSSTKDGLFSKVSEQTKENLLETINKIDY